MCAYHSSLHRALRNKRREQKQAIATAIANTQVAVDPLTADACNQAIEKLSIIGQIWKSRKEESQRRKERNCDYLFY
jgi:hypothetical protein